MSSLTYVNKKTGKSVYAKFQISVRLSVISLELFCEFLAVVRKTFQFGNDERIQCFLERHKKIPRFRVPIGSLMNPAALVRMGLAGHISDPTGHCQPLRIHSYMSF
jgi:hypothetical protein